MITENEKLDTVSVVIPVYNEEKYVELCIDSILKQDYDLRKVEIIFVDGNSTDNTKQLINKKLQDNKSINFKILDNPQKLTPISVNIGIRNANNEIIMRFDAHSEYPLNYISKCVYYLNNIDADNVGCLIDTEGRGTIGKCIENVLTSRFGVGNSSFRINAESGYVETVPFGTFRKKLIDKIGYFNEELIRSEDNEFNYRIIKNGGKVYLFNDIRVIYHPRNEISSLCKMAFQNGEWVLYTNYIMPGTMRMRHFVPMMFVLGISFGILCCLLNYNVAMLVFGVVMILYGLIDLYFSLKNVKKYGVSQLICLLIYPLFHISYGIGTIVGAKKILKRNRRNK